MRKSYTYKERKLKFLEIGEGGKIGDLTFHRNIMVVEDISKVETFISLGKNGEIINLDAQGNEVHTPESYSQKLSKERQEFFDQIKNCELEISSLQNEVMQAKIRKSLNEAKQLPNTSEGEFDFKKKLGEIKSLSKEVGTQLLTAIIMKYLGY